VSEKFLGYKEFRVMYVGAQEFMKSVKKEFQNAGAKCVSLKKPHCFYVSAEDLSKVLLESQFFPDVTINFFCDVHELVQELPVFNADLIILDERQYESERETSLFVKQKNSLESSQVLNFSATREESLHFAPAVCFETLRSALQKFTPPGFHYTMGRVVVVLPHSHVKSQREFQLSLQNVRAIVTDPPNFLELFLFAIPQLESYRHNRQKTSLCISGGGLDGYLYSVGVVQALDSCFAHQKSSQFDIFSGVSSGAFVAAALALGLDSEDLRLQIFKKHPRLEPLGLNTIFDLAGGEILRRMLHFFRAFSTFDTAELIRCLQQTVPTGFFKGEKLKKFFEKQIQYIGMKDNMSALKKELYISVTDQDTGENIVLGEEPWKDLPLSQAIRASTALPPFYLPERIKGHWFTDGQLTSASDFNVAIGKGAGLVVYIDPMVPYTSNSPGAVMQKGGYFTMIQAIKSLVHTRSRSLLNHAMDMHPEVDFVIFRPTDDLMAAMAGNPMKYTIHTELVDLGLRCTLSQILASYDGFAHKFAKHGFDLKSKDEIASLIS
jgi:predicted acylesterase/phospholipase RssA